MMDHQEVQELLPAYVDQELGIVETLELQRHLEGCADCQREYAAQRIVSARFKKEAAYFDAPAHLTQRIMAALPQDEASTRFWQRSWGINWRNAGAALAAMLALAWSVGLYLNLPSDQDKLTDEVVASHVRSLQVDHLSDVVSTDQHTVKPWFNGKLNFSPPVVDLASQGFPLTGGRLDYLGGRPVAALVYRHAQHPINLYIWPTTERDVAPQLQNRQGYHLVRWTWDGMSYWAVSDLAARDLEQFGGMVRSMVRQ
ncbi:anti-sigma factor [Collimonas sp.]|jgi:anti-sigma factor RsiW|uniref:anti-sigma factor family protein n=1 Tax=Collimonas sp. TaxID=1963772 RepID=UPI002B95462E|nr:anti-sigma factor [Collimonas sp.]HWX01585.1 anti-sigma factor [Collimonas sp.]